MRRVLLTLGIFFLGAGVNQFTTLIRSHISNPVINESIQITQGTSPSLLRPSDREQLTSSTVTEQTEGFEIVIISRIIDGDTVELSDGRKLRYIGIDTPEIVHPSTPSECFGADAKAENSTLVYGKTVRLEKDVSETDRYGRLLRYVYVGDMFVNEYLVLQGFAHASTFPPDVKYSKQFLEAEREARENNRGLWNDCSDTNSLGSSVDGASSVLGGSCEIKGNISSSGEKIYHVPGCGSYDKTTIDESKGERWFCGEDEAVGTGFRKAKNC